MSKTVAINCFSESVASYRKGYVIVAVDVIRATTTAVTVSALGRRCFPVSSLEAALVLAAKLDNPLLVGELAGKMPEEFHMNNSPADLARREDLSRPVVMLSSSGTRLIEEASREHETYLACFRNCASLVPYLAGRYEKVAVIGAGSRGEFRAEDQMCCAWIAGDLMQAGYEVASPRTANVIKRWSEVRPDTFLDAKSEAYLRNGNSSAYLRRSGQMRDFEFIMAHINDINAVFRMERGEVVMSSFQCASASAGPRVAIPEADHLGFSS